MGGLPMRAKVRDIFQTVLLGILIFLALQGSIQNFRVEGSSMTPALRDSQYLLVNKALYYRLDKGRLGKLIPFYVPENNGVLYPFHPPERGEVVVFKFFKDQSRNFVKRVIAVPGDWVEIRDGKVLVNDKVILESYAIGQSYPSIPKILLLDNQYFVLGDNRSESSDSRHWGPIHLDSIVGKAWISYWPFSELAFE
jgi:signal peptidase I